MMKLRNCAECPLWVDSCLLLTVPTADVGINLFECPLFVSANYRLVLRFQPVDATHALNLSAGVSNPNVLRGRSFS